MFTTQLLKAEKNLTILALSQKTQEQLMVDLVSDDSLLFDFLKENTAQQIVDSVHATIDNVYQANDFLMLLSDPVGSSILSLLEDDNFIDDNNEDGFQSEFYSDLEVITEKLKKVYILTIDKQYA